MDWVMFIIPVIAVGIWAIKTAIEKGAEANRNVPQPARPGGPRRSASSEIDRFLEEVNRRRQEQQRQSRRPAPPPPSRTIEVEVEAQPAPRPRPVYRPRPSMPPPIRRPVPEPIVVVAEPAIPEAIAVPATVSLATALITTAPPRVVRPVSPLIQELQGMLRTPRSLRTAFVLTEVFGKPKCHRRH
jgi:hypothetical protein